MFTGIIEEIGRIESVRRSHRSMVLTIAGDVIFDDLKIGDSVAVNGVCLTATQIRGKTFTADVMPESVDMTTLFRLSAGAPVNLERAMAASGRFGGHMVAGHVDGIGTVRQLRKTDNAVIFTIAVDKSLLEYIIYKGSVAIDGASLTVSAVGAQDFSVSIIPHTIANTVLSKAIAGTQVNIETDIAGRYIRHFMNI